MLYVPAPCKPKRRNTSSISPLINSRLNLPTCVTGSIDKPNTLKPIPDDCFLAPQKKNNNNNSINGNNNNNNNNNYNNS